MALENTMRDLVPPMLREETHISFVDFAEQPLLGRRCDLLLCFWRRLVSSA